MTKDEMERLLGLDQNGLMRRAAEDGDIGARLARDVLAPFGLLFNEFQAKALMAKATGEFEELTNTYADPMIATISAMMVMLMTVDGEIRPNSLKALIPSVVRLCEIYVIKMVERLEREKPK